MKKCPNCGRAYSDIISVCPECKISLNGNAGGNNTYQQPTPQPQPAPQPRPVPQPQPQPVSQYQQQTQGVSKPAKKDSGSFLWGIPGVLFPIVGVILYFCWKKSKPKTASVALKGAAIGFFLAIALQFVPI